MDTPDRFQPIFAELKALLLPFAPRLIVQADTGDHYALNTPYVARWKKEVFFGGVQIRKSYVSYYLMPVYMFPALLDRSSKELLKRMQGKSCFNFSASPAGLLDELADLTQRGFDRFVSEYR